MALPRLCVILLEGIKLVPTVPEILKLPPAILPAADTSPGVVKLPPAMFAVTFRFETTFELKLNPAAFKLPPVILPLTLTVVPVTLVVLTLPPVMLPLIEITEPVKVVPLTLPPVILPAALTIPGVVKLPPAMFAVTFNAETTLLLKLNPPAFKLAPVMLPVTLRLVPVAAPMLGVVKLAPALTLMLPPPSNSVVLLSTLVLNTVPTRLIPALVLAE